MNHLWERFISSPALVRVAPFVIVAGLSAAQGHFGPASIYWIYALKFIPAAGLLWLCRKQLAECSWTLNAPALMIGVAVFILWIGLDPYYPKWNLRGHGWNPVVDFEELPAIATVLVALRLFASTILVPPIEELFYRSFLYRWIIRPDFTNVPLGRFAWKPFLAGSLLFGATHREWLAGILCGMAYQGLVCWKGRLGDAMTAHAVTNALLGIYVIWKGAWQFW